MPAPIVLRALTPEVKKVDNPPAGQPVIATKAELRDGSRPGGNDPVDPGADPHDWQTILTGTGGGTVDPKFNPENFLTYLGAFRVPFFAGGSEPVSGSAWAHSWTYKAPDGSNGPNGSMFLSQSKSVAEVQIPALSQAADHFQLNAASVLQEFTDVIAKAPSGDINANNKIGWMKAVNGRLYMSTYRFYDGDASNAQNLMVCMDSSNLSAAAYGGMFDAYPSDYGARYICDVPASWQAALGHTNLAGVGPELSIVGRASFGHSLIGLDLENITVDTTSVSSTILTHYPNGSEINGFSITNSQVSDYYANLVWQAGEYDLADWYSAGDERVGNWGGITSTNLSAFCGLPITETGRETTLYQFPLPSPSIRNHAVQVESVCGISFVPPGTDTVAFIGFNEGSRYGQGYKNYSLESGPSGRLEGGYGPYSETDRDNFLWLVNLNDVVNSANVSDVQYYKYMPLIDPSPFNGLKGIVSGCFDAATNKLYVVSEGHDQDQFNKQHVVSVYQVGAA